MNLHKSNMTVLAQFVKRIPHKSVDNLQKKHKIQTRSFSMNSQVISNMFMHLDHSLSLNDVCDNLQAHAGMLSQIRNAFPPSRNGLSHANRTRNAQFAEDLFWEVYDHYRKTVPEFFTNGRKYPGFPSRLKKRKIVAFDSTTIQLTANCIDWGQHRRRKAAAKMHTGLDLQSFLPNIAIVKSAKDSDPKTAPELCASLKSGEIAVFDKAYVDFKHLNTLDERGVIWVTRAKSNMLYKVVPPKTKVETKNSNTDFSLKVMGQHGVENGDLPNTSSMVLDSKTTLESHKHSKIEIMGQQASITLEETKKARTNKLQDIETLSDERIILTGTNTVKHYKKELRLVKAKVKVKNKMVEMEFITNNFTWSACTICQLYQSRWGIEVFFKEIKQTLQLTDFMGYNENAVKWQIWIGLLVYFLLRLIAWENEWKHSFGRLYTLIRGVLLNYFKLGNVLEMCGKMGKDKKVHIRGTPSKAYQLLFDL